MATPSKSIHVDIVSDVMCPWCIVAYKHLMSALVMVPEVTLEVKWHPFELNPGMPSEGQDMYEHVAGKYGISRALVDVGRSSMIQIGKEIGFTFRYREGARIHNSFLLHQLLHWAFEQGGSAKETKLKLALFESTFTRGENVGSVDVLVGVAGRVGLDVTEARVVLQENRFADEVRANERVWLQRGIHSVPHMIFDHSIEVNGSQEPKAYADILRRLVSGSEELNETAG